MTRIILNIMNNIGVKLWPLVIEVEKQTLKKTETKIHDFDF